MSLSDFYVKLLSNQTFILFTYGEMGKEKSELIQEALDTLQAVTLSGRSTESYVAELFEDIRNLKEENKKLREENELLKQCLDKLMSDVDVVNIKIHGELGDYVYVRSDRQFKFNVED